MAKVSDDLSSVFVNSLAVNLLTAGVAIGSEIVSIGASLSNGG